MATISAHKSERVEMRATPAQRRILDRATAAIGLTRSDFVLQAALERAQEVIEKQSSITLENSAFDRFIEACESASKPNQALKDALEFTRAREAE